MTESNPAADEFEYDTTDVVLRQDDECYELVIWPVNGNAITETKAFTYSRVHGLYWVSRTDTPELFEAIESVVTGMVTKYRAVDETDLAREVDDSLEVLVTIIPEDEGKPYDASISAKEAEICVTSANDSWAIETLDEFFTDFLQHVESPEVEPTA
jgi:hypothetical protein